MLQAYIRWLTSKRRSPYRNTRLLGNPCEIIGYAPPPRRANATFSRAKFGKYEQREKKTKLLKYLFLVAVVILLGWVVWESVGALGLFQK